MAAYTPNLDFYPSSVGGGGAGGIELTFNQNTAATFLLVDAVPNRQIILIAADLAFEGANIIQFITGTSDAINGGLREMPAAGLLSLGIAYKHNIRTRPGERLAISLSAALRVRGSISYMYLPRLSIATHPVV